MSPSWSKTVLLAWATLVCLGSGAQASGLTEVATREDSNRVLSRHRRFFLPSSTGWSLNLRLLLTIPLQDIGTSLSAFVPFTYSFDTGTVTGRRSNRATDDHRQPVLQTIEDYVDRFSGGSINGHACILRAICEATEVPLYADNMVAHMINAMLIPVNMLDKFYRTQNDYIEAQHHGQYDQDCTRYYNDCDVSMFKIENTYEDNGWAHHDDFGNTILTNNHLSNATNLV